MLNVGSMEEVRAKSLGAELLQVAGVEEAVVSAEEGVAYLKVDSQKLDSDALERYSVPQS